VQPDPVEIRVLGCLVEKQRTTPDAYPLSVNALRLACNQSTNRDPVTDYGEGEVRAALERLGRRRWVRNASWAGSRAMKYKHVLDDALRLSESQLSLLAVLMLRGPQTPGELKARSDRLHRFRSLGAVEEALDSLIERELVARLPRRPGQKEERFEQLLGGEEEPADDAAVTAARPSAETRSQPDRIDELERRLALVEEELGRLRAELGS
jgi:uncharacterized protein YceH (UPF0502 family)